MPTSTVRAGLAGALAVLLAFGAAASVASGGQVSGAVSASRGPVANVRVTLFVPSLEVFLEERTGSDGAYVFREVAPGTYSLGVAAVGYDYIERAITMGDGVRRQDFTLAPESHLGSWDVIGDTLPELFDATDIAILLPDVLGVVRWCDLYDPEVDDIASMARIIRVVPAASPDLDGDGVVDGADMGLHLGAWGPCEAGDCPADLNGDGAVDGADMGLLLGGWG